MNIEDVRSGEQLFNLSAEPKTGVELQSVFHGLIWPDEDTLHRQAAKSALADSELVDSTIDWIEEVLQPEWVAPDLQNRLMAATAVIKGRDALLARYAIDETKIQIIVTRFSIHLVISPSGGFVQLEAPGGAEAFLNMQPDPEVPWTGGPWSILLVEGFRFGYQRRPLREWRDSLDYLTNGRSVKFSISKVQQSDGRPNKTDNLPTEQAESRWFQRRVEVRSQVEEDADG